MKTIKSMLLAIIVLTVFSANQARSQATVDAESGISIDLINPNTGEVVYTLTMGVEKLVVNSSGNFLRTVTFSIDKTHPIMNFSGPIKILEVSMKYNFDGTGEEKITDTMAVLTKSGNLKFVFHKNGAGSNLPPGWNF